MTIKRSLRILIFVPMLATVLVACDPERKKECEWTLMPEPEHKHQQDAGFFAVCARNFVTMRQKCRMQIEEARAKELFGKYFRLDEVKLDKTGKFPRKILEIQTCSK